ncbi:FAD-binding oxidoreductase [Pigmentiphaga aceris]|uniref:FAD-binding oxidoreductase n=1 Tax=Pigmentiphaga aceris TaxID=1940612 RepID=A0A5C0B3P6_9BURK|nr:FAD-binding oxidoreductase [Pigmentiphaga aceris]QEI07850.1 FAD-binding oxidoreductase [Pigmentiphaga aceris]
MSTESCYSPDFKTDPYWWDAAPPETAMAALPGDADVVIVGSGYCGLSAAIELAGRGLSVAVLDEKELGIGGSTRSGGMVSSGQKLVVSNAIKGVSEERRQRLLDESLRSFQFIKDLVQTNQLDADLAFPGRFFGAYTPQHYTRLQAQGALLHARTGVQVHDIDRTAQAALVGTNYYYGGILVDDYGGLHTAKYHRSLRQLARTRGATLHSHAPVQQVIRRGAGFEVKSGRGTIHTRHVVMATNGYTGSASPYLQRRLVPVTSYQIATDVLPPGLMDAINPRRVMISDSKLNLFYTRPSPDGQRILFGSRPAVFDISEAEAAARMYKKLLAVWPQLHGVRLSHSWKGRVAMTFDKLSHIGEEDGIHYAVGCNGNGVALMTYLGFCIARKIAAKHAPACAFDGGRFVGNPLGASQRALVPLATAAYELGDRWDGRKRDQPAHA